MPPEGEAAPKETKPAADATGDTKAKDVVIPSGGDEFSALKSAVERQQAAVERQQAMLEELLSSGKKKEADLAAAEEKATKAESEKKTLDQRVAEMEVSLRRSSVDGAVATLFGKQTFASGRHADQARKLFLADHKLELVGSDVIATGADGKRRHLADSFANWAKTDGENFLASPAQPGAGAPRGAAPEGQQMPDPMARNPDGSFVMTAEEFAQMRREGVVGPLTDSPYAPKVRLKEKQNRFAALRQRDIALATRMAQQNNGK